MKKQTECVQNNVHCAEEDIWKYELGSNVSLETVQQLAAS
jgi:hypothetical protein